MKQTKETRIYHFEDGELNNYHSRTAKIYFIKTDEEWQFEKCDFKTNAPIYNLKDWQFLSEIYLKIKEILKEIN